MHHSAPPLPFCMLWLESKHEHMLEDSLCTFVEGKCLNGRCCQQS